MSSLEEQQRISVLREEEHHQRPPIQPISEFRNAPSFQEEFVNTPGFATNQAPLPSSGELSAAAMAGRGGGARPSTGENAKRTSSLLRRNRRRTSPASHAMPQNQRRRTVRGHPTTGDHMEYMPAFREESTGLHRVLAHPQPTPQLLLNPEICPCKHHHPIDVAIQDRTGKDLASAYGQLSNTTKSFVSLYIAKTNSVKQHKIRPDNEGMAQLFPDGVKRPVTHFTRWVLRYSGYYKTVVLYVVDDPNPKFQFYFGTKLQTLLNDIAALPPPHRIHFPSQPPLPATGSDQRQNILGVSQSQQNMEAPESVVTAPTDAPPQNYTEVSSLIQDQNQPQPQQAVNYLGGQGAATGTVARGHGTNHNMMPSPNPGYASNNRGAGNPMGYIQGPSLSGVSDFSFNTAPYAHQGFGGQMQADSFPGPGLTGPNDAFGFHLAPWDLSNEVDEANSFMVLSQNQDQSPPPFRG
ncbi:hypothetical protein MKZ38_000374 [Zalerion maritima]|uniref:Uncharacterized protein n=1 Tax=Zalerion maritima TaxID=339359 RepID=A0AAD5RFK4_9PEZI|nr:hypothetical protein MKZ38_000374 [Zalerion maritima]